jgi:hypothetical protein
VDLDEDAVAAGSRGVDLDALGGARVEELGRDRERARALTRA